MVNAEIIKAPHYSDNHCLRGFYILYNLFKKKACAQRHRRIYLTTQDEINYFIILIWTHSNKIIGLVISFQPKLHIIINNFKPHFLVDIFSHIRRN